jgi:hypothetical protein
VGEQEESQSNFKSGIKSERYITSTAEQQTPEQKFMAKP